ncbi:MAG: GNAT family N-acetyltransferase [Thermoplasmata archaeon]|nr:GNAT family N-acetyltransferase [Thermoplasmata archaeon]
MIRGKKIDLVAVSMNYLPNYHKWINDPDVVDMLGHFDLPISLEQERKWVEKHLSGNESEKIFTILTKNGKPIGNIGLADINYTNRATTLGIMIGEKNYWNRGYGADAISTLLEFAFDTMGLHRIELRVNGNNERAIACYKKCGFKIEGKRRKHGYYHGEYINEIWMGILREEWDKMEKKESKKG